MDYDNASAGDIPYLNTNATTPAPGFTAVFPDSVSGNREAGKVLYAQTSGGALVYGDLCYFEVSSGQWKRTDATTVNRSKYLLGFALNATSGASEEMTLLVEGYIVTSRYDGAPQKGDPMFISDTTTGCITPTAPAAAGEVVRGVGWCINVVGGEVFLLFQPDVTWIEL